jgi:hypothetical protein
MGSSVATEEDDRAHVYNDSPCTYSVADFDTYSDNIAVCRKSSTSGPPKLAAKLMDHPRRQMNLLLCMSPFLPLHEEPTRRCCRLLTPGTPGAS